MSAPIDMEHKLHMMFHNIKAIKIVNSEHQISITLKLSPEKHNEKKLVTF